MSTPSAGNVTALLARWRSGTAEDRERLFAAVHGELHRIAAAYMRRERAGHTLQPSEVINEAYLRLVGSERVAWEGRAHFYGIAARAMREVLIQHARRRGAAKRGERARVHESLSKLAGSARGADPDIFALHEALTALEAIDPRQVKIVELRYFAGLTEEETAKAMSLSPATIRRDIAAARFWLGKRMASAT